jgi:endonuclease YncB( thermonuclease family)
VLLAPLFLIAPSPLQERPAIESGVEVRRVIDGDTLVIVLDGEETTLRLASVDTEEKISGRPLNSPTKPQTVYGEETALWAREFFDELGSPPFVGVWFPDGRRTDAYGRLLGHVILPDGRDFNLLLVQEGRSPYFNKYGNSRFAHDAFVRAQDEAQREHRGIWDPASNRAHTAGVPSAARPYSELLSWWDARAAAVAEFERRAERDPGRLVSAEDPAGLERALERTRQEPDFRVTVFCSLERMLEEPDGSRTALLRSADPRSPLRAPLPVSAGTALVPFLAASTAEFHQNYLYVEGALARDKRGYLLFAPARDQWRTAEPEYPPGPGQ